MRIKSFRGVVLEPVNVTDTLPLIFKSNLTQLPRVAGAYDNDGDEQHRQPFTFTRSFWLTAESYAAIEELHTGIRATANDGAGDLITVERDEVTEWTWSAKLKSVVAPHTVEALEWLLTELTFEIAYPWGTRVIDKVWLLDSGVFLDSGFFLGGQATSFTGNGSFVIDNDGSDRITRGVLVVDGPCTRPTISNLSTGEQIQFPTLVLTASQSLIIDIGAKTAKVSLVDVWGLLVRGSDQQRFLSLARGVNNIKFTDSFGLATLTWFWERVH